MFAAPAASAETARAFASPEACHSSGSFSVEECASAFVRASDLLRDRAPHFSDPTECALSFKLCEWRDGAHRPSMLGVEMRRTPGGTAALPVLAVEPPGGLLNDPPQRIAAPRRRPARSPFGDLLVDASILNPSGPQTLTKYRRVIEAARLRREWALEEADTSAVPAR